MGTTIIKVEVVEVIKEGRVAIAVGYANLWTNTSCICPRFRKSREYFILGHEDTENERLLYLRQALSYTWKNSYPRLIQVVKLTFFVRKLCILKLTEMILFHRSLI
jgi:hypothetical protein